MKPKLINGTLTGQTMPEHIGKAYGRYIFRLLHGSNKGRLNLWLRDLPLNICDLDYDYDIESPLRAYVAECNRVGVPAIERVADIIPI